MTHAPQPDPAIARNPVFGAAPAHPSAVTPRERHLVLDRPPEEPDLARRLLDVNRLALAAFALSLFGGGLLAVVLAVVSLHQVRETAEGGRRLAVAAIVLSPVWSVVLVARMAQGGLGGGL